MGTDLFSFAGRLPELCADLNRKLGGPVAASPPKPKTTVASVSATAFAKPGSVAKRPVAANAPKSLERFFESDQQKRKASRRPVDPLARMRSATPAAIPGLKREVSEPLGLERISTGDQVLKERPRNILSRSVSTSGTEDLKAQKKAKVEAELKEAISALKKPNRQMIGKSIVEEAAKRTGSSSSPHPRSTYAQARLFTCSILINNIEQKRPVRNAAAANKIQVKATPANFRFRDAVAADSRAIGSFHPPPPRSKLDAIPSSSSVIPATESRLGFRDDLRDDLAAFHIASTPAKVMATPALARASPTSFPKQPANDDFIPPSSPIISKKTATAPRVNFNIPGEVDPEPSSPVLPRLFETPVKQRSRPPPIFTDQDISSTPPEPRVGAVYFETPAKKAPRSAPATATASITAMTGDNLDNITAANNQPAPNLYQQMGWDDDYDSLIS